MRSPVDRESVEAFLSSHEPIDEPHLLADGQIVGEWSIRTFLGRGGNGEVYRATHTLLGIEAAIKVLTRNDELTRTRFRREAQIISTKAHPAFPHFFAFGELDGTPYLVIELLESYPLPGSDKDVAKYLIRVCEGVACLHGLGLVHRDIKPQNVLRRKGSEQPVLIDLGLAKDITLPPAHEGVSLSIVNGRAVGVGTPKYAAPEQFAGGEISPAADIHALGMLANDCFGGNPPLPWARIIRRSTSSIPSQRYGSVAQFAKAIRHRHWVNHFVLLLVGVSVVLGGVVFALRDSLPYRPRPRGQALASEMVPETNAPAVGRTLRVRRNPDQTNTTFETDYGAAGVRALPPQPQLRPGVRFVPDADSSAEPTHKGVKWPKSGVFSGDKEVDPNF